MHSLARQSARLASRRVLSAPLRSVVLNPVHMRSDRRVVPGSHNLYFSTKAKEVIAEEVDLENIVVPTAQSGVEHKSIEAHPEGVLVRDFVRESLYSEVGYFNSSRVINSPGVINFAQLVGRSDYTKRLQDLYYSGVQGWTTPVEIFQPYYAQAIARWMLSHIIPSVNLNSVVPEAALAKAKSSVDHSNTSTGAEYGVGDLVTEKDLAKKRPSRRSAAQTPAPAAAASVTTATAHVDSEAEGRARRFGVPLRTKDHSIGKLNVFEVGAGNGTCAVNILDFVRTYYPQVYAQTHYNIIEMSESLSWQQRELLDANHAGHYRVHTANAAEWKQTQSEHAVVFGLEVLDNMPHDKVVRGKDGQWYQVMVAKAGHVPGPDAGAGVAPVGPDVVDPMLLNCGTAGKQYGFVEYAVPLSDPVVARCAAMYDEYLAANNNEPVSTNMAAAANNSEQKEQQNWLIRKFIDFVFTRRRKRVRRDILYLPTECLRFFMRLDAHFPSHTLFLADFDVLPSTEAVQGVHGPVVAHKSESAKARGKTEDADSYLVSLGLCDIFYPTDFAFLKHMYCKVVLKDAPYRDAVHHFGLGRSENDMHVTPKENVATVITHFDFLWKYAETSKTECRNGFNPLLEDYTNMAIFIGSRQEK